MEKAWRLEKVEKYRKIKSKRKLVLRISLKQDWCLLERNDQYEQVIGKEHANFLFYFQLIHWRVCFNEWHKRQPKSSFILASPSGPHLSLARVGINLAQTKFLNWILFFSSKNLHSSTFKVTSRKLTWCVRIDNNFVVMV